MKRGWSLRLRLTVGLVPLAIAGTVGAVLIWPLFGEAAALDAESADVIALVRRGDEARVAMREYREQQQPLVESLLRLEQLAAPRREAERDRLTYLRSLEAKTGVQLRVSKQGKKEPYELGPVTFTAVPLELVVNGPLHAILGFAELLQHGSRLYAIESMKIEKSDSGNTEMRLSVHSLLSRKERGSR